MKEHHLQLNLAKTELLVFPATPTLQYDFMIQLGSSTISTSASVRNLGVIFDDQLTFKEHIAKTARSCRFGLHNIRKIRPFLTEHAAQLLVQAIVISRLDYCNALLAALPSNTIKPLQMIQNAVAQLVFNDPKRAHVTPLVVSLHWLPVAARIQFKTPMLAYKTTTGSAPTYFHSLLRIYIPSRCLRSANERHLVVPSQRSSKSLSRTFWFTTPGWWNDLPTPIRNTGSLSIFKQQLKIHLFQHFFFNKKLKYIYFFYIFIFLFTFLSFPFLSFFWAVVGLMDRALDLKPEVTQGCGFESRLRQEVHDCSPGAAQSAAHCSKCYTLGWVKCREHISLLIILCIIVYVTNKAHPFLALLACIYLNNA